MTLISSTYGKGRVRVMRINKVGAVQEPRELNIHVMLTGKFSQVFTDKDNALAISTDTMKNLVNIVARENLALGAEDFCAAVAQRFFERYEQVDGVTLKARETKWKRLEIDGKPHDHSFVLDNNGNPFVELVAERGKLPEVSSGVSGFTFMKTTQSGWDKYLMDPYTTIRETRDRIAATSLEARWKWKAVPASYENTNTTIIDTMMQVFATTYSESVQDSLYRMAMAALAAVPEIETMSLAAPNKHYLLMNLEALGLSNENAVFLPTDEPHGQIECVVGRD